jgi:hypothetical protein
LVRITTLLMFGAVGAAAAYMAGQRLSGPGFPEVRDAGPDNMTSPPGRWDMVDQQLDESFPASDPPANY